MLEKSIENLCRSDRVPKSEGYLRTQIWLKDEVARLGFVMKEHKFLDFPMGRCCNLYVETGPEVGERLLLGAHYESRKSSGLAADDNASAVAVLLEVLAAAPKNIPMTFVFFDVEENFGFGAIHGSEAFAKYYKKPLKQVVILDLVGGKMTPHLEECYYQFGNGWARLKHPQLQFHHLPMKFLEPFGKWVPRSDYHPFRNRGVPFTFISTGTPWYYHTEHDTLDKLNFTKMKNLVEVLLQAHSFPVTNQEADWSDWKDYATRLWKSSQLQSPLLKKAIDHGAPSSRWEIIKLHKEILGKIRKLGPEIFR